MSSLPVGYTIKQILVIFVLFLSLKVTFCIMEFG